ncbi:hypothetical protein M9458_054981 [Cirrhinus mrigala]|uniref:Uncharacterized protein n=1 Tax=Cirrhinus mrigala TaxID=683832 RepID=A0ABD0MKS7_CIRMR
MAESPRNNCYGSALRPKTERHGTESPNVTTDQMLDNLNVYLDKRLGLRKCDDGMCQRYSIKHSESGQWALPDIKRAYRKTQRLWTNTKNTKVRLTPVIIKNRLTEVEIDNEEEYEENGERPTRTVKKLVKKYVPYRTYQPATPEQVDKWSKELPDVYKQSQRVWQFLQRLQKIYNLHPLDSVMIVNVNLRDNDQKRLTESVERKIGESQENIEDGWEVVQTFLFELKPVEVNWAKITSCMHKAGESVAEFEEHFRQTWTEHAGVNNNSEDLSKDTSMPLKATFVNGLKPEISQALKIKYDDWDSIGTTFIQIVEWSAKIEKTQDVQLRALQSKTLYNNRTMGYEKGEYQTHSKTKPQGRCRICNKEGHWVCDCKMSLKHQSNDEDNLLKRQKQTLLNAHQLVTSHTKADGLHVYANKTNDVLEGSAANQAVKERGPHTAALRQLKLHRQQDNKQMQNEEHKEVFSLIEIRVELQDDNQCSEGNHKEIMPF